MAVSGALNCWLTDTIPLRDVIVRPRGQLINRVKVPVGVCHNAVAISNCVIVKWGGEQLEAKRQSVGTRIRFGRARRRVSGNMTKPENHQLRCFGD